MAQFSYDVIPRDGGWAIVITPGGADTFPTRQAAFDAAVEFARKLRFVGYAVDVRIEHEPKKAAVWR
jgi:hypothetical protein